MGKLILGFIGMVVIVILFSCLMIKIGWMLFIVPVFGLPDLTWLQAFGFSILAGAFKTSSLNNKKD